MPEYLKHRCCMCPNINNPPSRICPGKSAILHPHDEPCRFVKVYRDERGWQYFVRSGIGGDTFKTFYTKPGGCHGYRSVPWQNTFDAAQADLNALAKKKGWQEETYM